MASSKDTFEGHSFRAHSFASGMFRGTSPPDTSIRDRWADVITLNTDQRHRITAIIEADRLDALAIGNRSELLADHGRTE